MKRFAYVAAAAVMSLAGSAAAQIFTGEIPANYYSTIDTTNATTLRTTLNARLKLGATQISFSNSNNSYAAMEFGSTDHYDILIGTADAMSYVRMIYSADLRPIDGNTRSNNSNPSTGGYNREHTWPQSFYNSANPMVSDIHGLYPEDADINSTRGSFGFGTVVGGSVDPFGNRQGSSLFEPRNRSKGDSARSIFYMDLRYENSGSNDPRNLEVVESIAELGSDNNKMAILSTLLQWHFQDPPDNIEYVRNHRVYNRQGNANPFIDNPQWISTIYGVAAPTPTDGEVLNLAFQDISPASGNPGDRFVPVLSATTTFAGNEYDLASLDFEVGGSFPLTTASKAYVFIDENQNGIFDRGDVLVGVSDIDSSTITTNFFRPIRINQLVTKPRLLVCIDVANDPNIDGTQLQFAIAQNGAASTTSVGAGIDANPVFSRLETVIDFNTSVGDWMQLVDF